MIEATYDVDELINDLWLCQHIEHKGARMALCRTIIRFVDGLYPDQLSLAQQRVELITDPAQLEKMLYALYVLYAACTDEDATRVLLASYT